MENNRIAFAKVLATANAFGFVAKCKSGNLTAGFIKIIEFSTGTVHCYKKRYDANEWESATF